MGSTVTHLTVMMLCVCCVETGGGENLWSMDSRWWPNLHSHNLHRWKNDTDKLDCKGLHTNTHTFSYFLPVFIIKCVTVWWHHVCVPQVVLFHEGLTSLIAHIRVGNMQVALETKSTVLPAISKCVCSLVSLWPLIALMNASVGYLSLCV